MRKKPKIEQTFYWRSWDKDKNTEAKIIKEIGINDIISLRNLPVIGEKMKRQRIENWIVAY